MERIKIFIADDDIDDIALFGEALSEVYSNVEMVSFPDGESFSNKMKDMTVRPDIIFLDINMPYINGKECLRQLRNDIRFHRIPIIMLTTSGTREDIMESFYAGATRYITKPAEFKELVDLSDQLISQYLVGKLCKTDLLNFVMRPFSVPQFPDQSLKLRYNAF